MSLASKHGVRSAMLAGTLLVLAGCASGRETAPSHAKPVRVTERDFHISAPTGVRAGDVRFIVSNRGPVAHELIVVRQGPSRLPLRRDGLTVDEDAVVPATLGTLEPGEPGSVRVLSAHLRPGRYELFCNMSGHFLGGMRRELVVR